MKRLFIIGLVICISFTLVDFAMKGRAQAIRPDGLDEVSRAEGKILKAARKVPNQYIVVFKDEIGTDVLSKANELSFRHKGLVLGYYQYSIKGFVVRMAEKEALAMSKNRNVAYIEEDGLASTMATQPISNMIQDANWGLDRIDQRAQYPLSRSYTWNNTGQGVNVYVIDTGIYPYHTEFGNRVTEDYDAVRDGYEGWTCDDHATHVAGIIGGTTYGVAKGVKLHSVRALRCNTVTETSTIINGIDWVAGHHVKPAVANLSFAIDVVRPKPNVVPCQLEENPYDLYDIVDGGALDSAVRNLIATGVITVVAAGNSYEGCPQQEVTAFSPARVAEAITVSATDIFDRRFSYAAYGTGIDIFAPGVEITSATNTGWAARTTKSGTSMAAPFVTGVVAKYLQSNPTATQSQVVAHITSISTHGVVRNIPFGTTDSLLFTQH